MAAQNDSQQHNQRRIAALLADRRDEILNLWIKERLEADEFRDELISKKDLRQQSQQVLDMLVQGVQDSGGGDLEHPAFDDLRSYLNEISHMRAVKGYTPLENATYILSLRNVIAPLLAEEMDGNAESLIREINFFTRLLDKMGLVMVENFIRSREEVIRQQRADMLEL